MPAEKIVDLLRKGHYFIFNLPQFLFSFFKNFSVKFKIVIGSKLFKFNPIYFCNLQKY